MVGMSGGLRGGCDLAGRACRSEAVFLACVCWNELRSSRLCSSGCDPGLAPCGPGPELGCAPGAPAPALCSFTSSARGSLRQDLFVVCVQSGL